MGTEYNISDLAAAGGVTARAVRFYVQQGLLDPPVGLGRGSHYTEAHLDRLRRIRTLQQAGHSLEEVRQIVTFKRGPGAWTGPAEHLAARRREREAEATREATRAADAARGSLAAQLVTRVSVADGVVIEFDAATYQPAVEELLELRELARRVFRKE